MDLSISENVSGETFTGDIPALMLMKLVSLVSVNVVNSFSIRCISVIPSSILS